MALIKCPDCGTDVSDAAPACPKCGRPSEFPPSSKVEARRPRSAATVTVTLSSFVLIALAIFAAIWFVPPLEIGQSLQASCTANGTGEGSCQFTNTGWTPGSQCVVVKLINHEGGAVSSGPVCSGRVWPNDTIEKSLSIAIGHNCDDPALGFPNLSTMCSMDIRNVGSDGAEADASAPAPGPQAGTAGAAPATPDTAAADTDPAPTNPGGPSLLSVGDTIAEPFNVADVVQRLPSMQGENGADVEPLLVFASAPFPADHQTERFLLVSYAVAGDCHACAVTIAGGVFTQSGGGWVLTSWEKNLASLGGFGKLGGSATAIELGSHLVVNVETSDMGQGEEFDGATLFGVVGNRVAELWNGQIGLDDSGTLGCEQDSSHCAKWQSNLHKLPAETAGWPDLQLHTIGTEQRDDGPAIPVDRTEVLQFDGGKYVAETASAGQPAAPSSAATPIAGGSSLGSPAATPSVLQEVIANKNGPSFDCSKVTDPTALTICSNGELSQLDRQMAILYYSRTNYATDRTVRDEQRTWIRDRDASCVADVVCLRTKYQQRIQQLQQVGATPGV